MQHPDRAMELPDLRIRRGPPPRWSATCARMDAARRFGSNHPFSPATDCLAGFDALVLDKPIKPAFLHDNAAKVFGLA
jgi:hypothetical protein